MLDFLSSCPNFFEVIGHMTGSEIFSLIFKPSIWIPSEPDDRPHTAGPKHTEEMPAIGKGCKREP